MLENVLIPAAQKDSRRLMVVLHGLGDSMEGYRWLPDALQLPWLNYLLVNAPDDYFGGYSWYDLAGNPGPGIERSRRLLVELLEAQIARGFAARQMVLFGFSQGCLMVLETGLRFPQVLAGLTGISGYINELEKLMGEASPVARQQRILMTHGTYDPLIPIAPVRQQAQQLKAAGLNVQWQEFRKEHTIAGEEELRVIREFVQAGFPDA